MIRPAGLSAPTLIACTVWAGLTTAPQVAPAPSVAVERFEMRSGGLELRRPTRSGTFFDVVGRRSAIFGYENREWEAWVYPLKVVDDFRLSFRLEGYPLDIDGRGIMTHISVRPEATTLTYAHAAFTVRQIMMAPLDEPGILVLLDVSSVLPLTITASFKPRLRLMWPATSMTANIGWNASAHVYALTEETRRYAAVIGCPFGRDASVMPYQEEPRDVPNQLVIEAPAHVVDTQLIPIVIAGSVQGLDAAQSTYDKVLASARSLYEQTAEHYERLDRDTQRIDSPDARLNMAFRWAKVGIDKGMTTSPLLGTGLVAGFRRRATANDQGSPGFSDVMRSGRLWRSTRMAISPRRAQRSNSCESSSGKTARFRMRSPRVRRSCHGLTAIPMPGRALTPRRSTSSRIPTTGARQATKTSSERRGRRSSRRTAFPPPATGTATP
jgi:hypothetical protein